MPYVERRDGLICGVYSSRQNLYAEEFVQADDTGILEFWERAQPEVNSPELYAIADISIFDSSITSVTTSAQISAVFYILIGS